MSTQYDHDEAIHNGKRYVLEYQIEFGKTFFWASWKRYKTGMSVLNAIKSMRRYENQVYKWNWRIKIR